MLKNELVELIYDIDRYLIYHNGTYTYSEEDKFILNKDDETIKDKIPAYITEADLETYKTNHKTAKE